MSAASDPHCTASFPPTPSLMNIAVLRGNLCSRASYHPDNLLKINSTLRFQRKRSLYIIFNQLSLRSFSKQKDWGDKTMNVI